MSKNLGVKVQSIIQKPHDPEAEAKEQGAKKKGSDGASAEDVKNGSKSGGSGDKKDGEKKDGEGKSKSDHSGFDKAPPEHYKLPPGRHLEADHPWAGKLNPTPAKEDSKVVKLDPKKMKEYENLPKDPPPGYKPPNGEPLPPEHPWAHKFSSEPGKESKDGKPSSKDVAAHPTSSNVNALIGGKDKKKTEAPKPPAASSDAKADKMKQEKDDLAKEKADFEAKKK